MKPEVFITYIVLLKYGISARELMDWRYSEEASDRVKYEMLVLTAANKLKTMDTNKALNMPMDFSEFIENHLDRIPNAKLIHEAFIRMVKI